MMLNVDIGGVGILGVKSLNLAGLLCCYYIDLIRS